VRQLDLLRPGQNPNWKQYNDLVQTVNALAKIRGVGGVSTRVNINGVTVSGAGNTGSLIRRAYMKSDAGAIDSARCYLGVDATGPEIGVQCEIAGGTKLNSAIPRLENGDMIPVWNDSGTWRPFFPFQASIECE